MKTQLTEEEWRTIYDALSVRQSLYESIEQTDWVTKKRQELQELTNKIRGTTSGEMV